MKFNQYFKYVLVGVFFTLGVLAFLFLFAPRAHAQSGASLWKLSGTTLSPVNSAWTLTIPGMNNTGSTRCVQITSAGLLQVASAACGSGGGGSSTALDLGDNGSDESAGITEIATTGDTNSIFSEPSADKLLINLGLDWPKADTADDLTCTDCIGTTEISDSYVLNTGDTVTGDLYVNALLQVGNGATSGGEIRIYEDSDNGSNFLSFVAPSTIGSDRTCNLQNLSPFIPDSCVGNGTDDTGLTSVSWGDIIGTLSSQTDLQTELDAKLTTSLSDGRIWIGDNTGTAQENAVSGDITITNAGVTAIGNDKVVEADLKAVDSASDEECLTYETTTGDFEWQTCGAGGSTTFDSIGDPTTDGSIDFTSFTSIFQTALDGGDFFSITSSDSDFTSETVLLALNMRDNGDADGIFLDFTDDVLGTPNSVFSVGADGNLNSDGTGTFGSTISTPTLTLTGTGTLNGLDAVDATTESTIESIIDTLANLTSIQGQAMSFAAPLTIPADPNADRFLFWDDSASATAWLTPGNGLTITTTTVAVDSASDTVDGIVELATIAETNTGTDATRAVTPDGFAGSNAAIRYISYTLNATTALTTSEKGYKRIPAGMNGMNLISVTGSVGTGAAGSSSSGTPTFTVKNVTDNNQMLSTSLTIDASEYTSATAATPAVINTSFDDVATDDLIEVAVTTAGTGVTYAVITLGFQLP
mgnify:CR=1 FL=1